jgi:hypothetical protein
MNVILFMSENFDIDGQPNMDWTVEVEQPLPEFYAPHIKELIHRRIGSALAQDIDWSLFLGLRDLDAPTVYTAELAWSASEKVFHITPGTVPPLDGRKPLPLLPGMQEYRWRTIFEGGGND